MPYARAPVAPGGLISVRMKSSGEAVADITAKASAVRLHALARVISLSLIAPVLRRSSVLSELGLVYGSGFPRATKINANSHDKKRSPFATPRAVRQIQQGVRRPVQV